MNSHKTRETERISVVKKERNKYCLISYLHISREDDNLSQSDGLPAKFARLGRDPGFEMTRQSEKS